jgi:hypothetical protein
MRATQNEKLLPLLALLAILALTAFVYRAGLHGPFLFDDFANLPSLGETGPVDSFDAFTRYATASFADPTGRPISVVSFLLDARNWPADPYPFKRTNLVLHLLNGALLAWFLTLLSRALDIDRRRAAFAGVLGAALWLLHPFFVSTTLYIVQREAMLPATFMLEGLIAYLYARDRIAAGSFRAVWLAGVVLAVATLLATLSKGNGALLPLFAWLVETTVIAPRRPISDARARRAFVAMRWICLVLPTLAVLAFLAKTGYVGFVHGTPPERSWTTGERLLSEARIVMDYIGLLWMPRPYTGGLFNDGYAVSTGILSPPTTLASIAAIAGLIAGAVALRKRHAALAFAVLFFFAGHLLESTTVALELYFEHRNYIPAMPMFWPLALWLCGARAPEPAAPRVLEISPGLRAAIAGVLVLGLAGMTYLNASLWGKPFDQALVWARVNPDSPRAQAYAAQLELERGMPNGLARLDEAFAAHPDEIQLALNYLGARCRFGGVRPEDIVRAETALRESNNIGRLGYEWFKRGLSIAEIGTCPGLDLGALDGLVDAAQHNERAQKIRGRRQDLLSIRGQIALERHDGAAALRYFDGALDADPRPGAALAQAAMLASAGYPRLAKDHLDHLGRVWQPSQHKAFDMRGVHGWILQKQGYWDRELAHLRKTLDEDIAADSARNKTRPGSP